MKKSILFSMAIVAALSSCTKDNIENNNENNDLVAIQFGAKNGLDVSIDQRPYSRASVDEWNDTNVGIFVLAKKTDNVTPDWTTFDPDAKDADILWSNVSATIATGGKATVTFDEPKNGFKYYPNQGTKEYNFYGYYPYEADNITSEATKVSKVFTIDGSQDLLWGKADPVEGGYNAKYVRDNDNAVPAIKFGHLLTKLQFKVKAADGFAVGQTFKIKQIKINNVPTTLTLTVADQEEATEGQLTPGAAENIIYPYNDLEGEGTEINSTSTTPNNIGDAVMLYSNNTDQAFSVSVVMEDPEGVVQETNSIDINPKDNVENKNYFQVGYAYNVTLTLNSFVLVDFTADLAPWETGEDVDVEI